MQRWPQMVRSLIKEPIVETPLFKKMIFIPWTRGSKLPASFPFTNITLFQSLPVGGLVFRAEVDRTRDLLPRFNRYNFSIQVLKIIVAIIFFTLSSTGGSRLIQIRMIPIPRYFKVLWKLHLNLHNEFWMLNSNSLNCLCGSSRTHL